MATRPRPVPGRGPTAPRPARVGIATPMAAARRSRMASPAADVPAAVHARAVVADIRVAANVARVVVARGRASVLRVPTATPATRRASRPTMQTPAASTPTATSRAARDRPASQAVARVARVRARAVTSPVVRARVRRGAVGPAVAIVGHATAADWDSWKEKGRLRAPFFLSHGGPLRTHRANVATTDVGAT